VEIREQGVISPGGILESADSRWIDYREEDRAGCLVKVALALRRFLDLTNVTMIRLGPALAVEQIRPLLDDLSFACTCQSLRGAIQVPPRPVPVFPIKSGLFVQLRGIAPGELVRIAISARGRTCRSDYEFGGYCRRTGEGIAVALSIQQSQEYEGKGFWRWSVRLDGTAEELDSIDHVLYILDPTFHNPVRTVSDRTTNFRLDTSSWGTFTIHANVMHRDGHETPLNHDLVLLYPDGTPTAA
jgi:hypothetical protein